MPKMVIYPQENLAKSRYKPKIKGQMFNHPSTYLATQWKPHIYKFSKITIIIINNNKILTFGD